MQNNQKLLYIYLTLAAGFAMFSMFFGSGNIVFPIAAGFESEGRYFWSTTGFNITAVIVPFLGLYAMILFNGNYKQFFSSLDKYSAFLVPFLILLLLGPLGVVPRSVVVAHGNFLALYPDFPLSIFSIVFVVATFLCLLNTRYVVPFLGVIMTPLLLLALVVIVGFALFAEMPLPQIENASFWKPLAIGFLEGYNTMDLMASFFFAHLIIDYIKTEVHTKVDCRKKQKRIEFASMVVAGLLLAGIYSAFVFLGFKYKDFLDGTHPEQALSAVAHESLGTHAGAVVVAAAILANITTAIALVIVSADFFREKIAKNKISRIGMIAIVLTISAFISNFEFSGIFAFLSPILIVLYPALIVLTILNILDPKLKWKYTTYAFYGAVILTFVYQWILK